MSLWSSRFREVKATTLTLLVGGTACAARFHLVTHA